ncbi:sigma factor-like helix-turn-helix DNA-binding protein [Kitasatospora sp. NPDC088351]|uniref:sigma factor-like helix-turn-helix DNA-binding protein n=1 Tax=unclassified Kitasatospora TaxID=2633591 RepID=UPI003429FA54
MNESDWAVRRSSRLLTFDAFCDTHERAWSGIARARLGDEDEARRVVERAKDRMWQRWAWILRQQVPAFHAWTLLKEEIGAALAEAMIRAEYRPRPATVPGWVVAVRRSAARTLDLVEAQGSHEELYAAIRRLSERRHDVVVLRYLVDLPDSVIADYLGMTEANVRSTATQALDRLAVALGGRRGGQR